MSKFIEKKSPIGESYHYLKHRSGLDIYVIPKDFATSYAVFATRYGAIDNLFEVEGDGKGLHEVPDGIAHYLEHKMFESEDGVDTFARFAENGASANAFTTSNMTAYLFSCTNLLYENLEILLDYVSKPWFTPENVEKERGIIGQEIRMYEDDPGSALYYNLLSAMYEKHQTRINVAGTVDSIARITPELLYDCYYTFYNFSNMTLCISGRADPEKVLELVDRILPDREQKNIIRHYHEEKPEVYKPRVSASFAIAKPMFMIGVKSLTDAEGTERLRRNVTMDLLTDMLFGDTSPFAIDVYETGLVNGFDASAYHGEGGSKLFLEGETDEPETVYEKVQAYLAEVSEKGLSREDFDRIKRASYASYIKMFDSTRLADEYLFMLREGYDPFTYGEALQNVTFEDAKALFSTLFKKDYFAMSVVTPKEA